MCVAASQLPVAIAQASRGEKIAPPYFPDIKKKTGSVYQHPLRVAWQVVKSVKSLLCLPTSENLNLDSQHSYKKDRHGGGYLQSQH